MKKLFRSLRAKAVTGFLLSNLENKIRIPKSKIQISNVLYYLLILFLPTQFGRHFWPDFSFIKGIRVDYLSPTPYTTDILIFLIFIIWVIEKFKGLCNRHSGKRSASKIRFWTSQNDKKRITPKVQIIFFSAILIGIIHSKSPTAGFYGLLKFLEFVFLGFYTAQNINKLKFKNILLMFSIGIIFESFLAISQSLSHGSVNGIFYFFGERAFNSLTPGIANASLGGELILRPYGTFSHPNVLAGYLVIVMALIIFNFKFSIKSKFSIFNFKTFLPLISLILGTSALVLTLSRVAILIWIIIPVFYFIRKFIIHNSYFLILFLVGLLLLGLTTPFGARFTQLKLTDESIAHRESLIESSIGMIKDYPVFGVGLNNFLVNLPSYQALQTPVFYLQPVHNIFLLILSETGIVGFLFFIWFLTKTYRLIDHKSYILILLTSALTLGMFDHYFLTLQQGQLLFAFVLGLCWCEKPLK